MPEAVPSFAGVIDAAPDAMVVADGEGQIVLANRQASNIFGYSRERLVGMSVEELMPPRFRDRHREHRRVFMANPKVRPMGTTLEIFGLRQSGDEFAVDASLAPWVAEDGTLYVVAALRDVSARKAQQQTLDAALYQVTNLRQDAEQLRGAVAQYAEITRRGLIKASFRGVLVVFLGIILAISMLGVLAQTWTCDANNLSKQKGSPRYKVCAVVFPQTVPQVASLQRAQAAAKQTLANQAAILDERTKAQKALNDLPAKLACILKIRPQDRTDANVDRCLNG